MKIKKNDMVVVVAGNSRGIKGKVLMVDRERERVLVEGVNLRIRHTRPSGKNQQGGRVEKAMSVHVSNVMLVDPKSNEPTRIGTRIEGEGKERKYVRVAKKSGDIIR